MISQQLSSQAYKFAGPKRPKARMVRWGMIELRSRDAELFGRCLLALKQPHQISHARSILTLWGRGRVVLPAPALDQFENHPLLRLSLRRWLLNSQTGQSFLRCYRARRIIWFAAGRVKQRNKTRLRFGPSEAQASAPPSPSRELFSPRLKTP